LESPLHCDLARCEAEGGGNLSVVVSHHFWEQFLHADRVSQRPREIQQGKQKVSPVNTTHSLPESAELSLGPCQPPEPVRLDGSLRQFKTSVLDTPLPARSSRNLEVSVSFFIVPDARNSLRMVAVVVILMNGTDNLQNVHDRRAETSGSPNEPAVPPYPANDKREKFWIQSSSERKVIDVMVPTLNALGPGASNDAGIPICHGKIDRLRNRRVPPPPNH
jgi:hypothetical protein